VNNTFRARLDVKHKPRGSKGQWFKIEKGKRIRVDKRKGKLLELVMTFPQDPNIDVSFLGRMELKVFLLDADQPSQMRELQPETKFDVPSVVLCESEEERAEMGSYCLQLHFRVRIYVTSRRQSFLVRLSDPSSSLVLNSLEFCSDDNGRPSSSLPLRSKRSPPSSIKSIKKENYR